MASNQLGEGAEVFSADGKKLGKVRHFFSAAPESGESDALQGATAPEVEAQNAGAADGIAPGLDDAPRSVVTPGAGPGVTLGADDTKYMEVHHGGHLHIGGDSIYVPFTAINVVEDDGSVILRYSADQVASRYSQRPAPLDA